MKRVSLLILSTYLIMAAAFASGCANIFISPRYGAMAIVGVDDQDAMPAEVRKLQEMGNYELLNTHSRCRVVPLGSSGGLIRISVFATSREDAAEACNRIAKKYIAGSFGKARLIDGAR
jgi:hypothetical protein